MPNLVVPDEATSPTTGDRRALAAEPSEPDHEDRRRFTIAVAVGAALAVVPYLWVLWDRFSDALRGHPSGLFSDFNDAQARAITEGHLWVPRGRFGIEGFVIDGREYMYFGLFPSVLRIPFLGSDLEGDLTAPSMLLAWIVTAVFVAMLMWRVRVVMRGAAPVSRLEACALGVVAFAVMGGSTLVLLAAIPAVYQEAIAWGVATTIPALFFLLGILERATVWRVVGYGAFTAGAVLSRTTVGWACVLGGVIAGIWLLVGRAGDDRRRVGAAVVLAALVPLAIGLSVTWIKFGGPLEHPLEQQVYSQTNAERQAFLEANDGALFNLEYIPTTLLAYLRPDGISVSSEYPFVTSPRTPPDVVGDVVFDQTFRTPSLTASMPLLVLLALWGLVTAFRPRPHGRTALVRIPLVAAAFGAATILVWEGISPRFMADALPLLVLASAVATVDLWRRLEASSRRGRIAAVSGFAILAVVGVVANVGAGTQLNRLAWRGAPLHDYVESKRSASDVTGSSLDIEQADGLPDTAPADRLFVVGDCDALYISTGEQYFPRFHALDYGEKYRHPLDITYAAVDQGRIPIVEIGDPVRTTISVEDRPIAFQRWMRIRIDGPEGHKVSRWIREEPGQTKPITLSTDPNIDRVAVDFRGERVLDEPVEVDGPVEVLTRDVAPDGTGPQLEVAARRAPPASYCREVRDSEGLRSEAQAGSSSNRNW